MSNTATMTTPSKCLDSLAPGPHLTSPPSEKGKYPASCSSSKYSYYDDQYEKKGGGAKKGGMGYKLIVGLIVFTVILLITALVLYFGRPPIVLEDIETVVPIDDWPISYTKLWGWSALFALVIAIIAMFLA